VLAFPVMPKRPDGTASVSAFTDLKLIAVSKPGKQRHRLAKRLSTRRLVVTRRKFQLNLHVALPSILEANDRVPGWRHSVKGAAMTIRPSMAVALVALLLACAASAPAWPRIWKGSPHELARDYVTITDVRTNGELITLLWFVPAMIEPEAPGGAVIKPLLDKYLVMAAIHAKLDRTTGTFSFDDIGTLEAKDQTGKPLTLIARSDLPPTMTGVIAALGAIFRKSLGALGEGTKVFVFDADGVNSCKPGGLTVPFAGENYTWQTPVPGCSAP
jgi:hypothetical protein